VHAVTTVLNDNGCDITAHQQFDDPRPRDLSRSVATPNGSLCRTIVFD
jgi:hypothetical protein